MKPEPTRRSGLAIVGLCLLAVFRPRQAKAGAALPPGPVGRLPPADAISPSVAARFQLQMDAGRPVLNIHRLVAYAPELSAPYGDLVSAIRNQGLLPRRYRELAIMRVASLAGSEYEWLHHQAYFLDAGYSPAQMADLKSAIASGAWSAADRAVIAFVDAAGGREGRLTDAEFAALQSHFTAQEIVELILTTGTYRMTALLANALEVQMEGGG